MSRLKRVGAKHRPQSPSKSGRQIVENLKSLNERVLSTEIATYRHLCKVIHTSFSMHVLDLVDRGCWKDILLMSPPDVSSDTFADDYLIYSVMRKNPRLDVGVDRQKVSYEAFYHAEKLCCQTNELFESVWDGVANFCVPPQVLLGARAFLARVLGELKHKQLSRVHGYMRFGPGATFHCSSDRLTVSKKIESEIGLTPRLAPYVSSLCDPLWVAASKGFTPCKGNKACTVPKTALTDRFIAIEPLLNLYGQLGIGKFIRYRMRQHGLDLDLQADVNRLLVKNCQRDGNATIDLSSASDTVSYNLVKELLPPDWFALLDLFRSPRTLIEGEWVELEKFSSMGNGYTFELESLIFWALARQYDPKAVVFGDDIIVSQTVAPALVRTLNFLGFKVNREKTYMAGVFFESCGVDVWNGQNVRPFYFKAEYYDYPSSIIRMANAIRRYALRRGNGHNCDRRFFPVWHRLISRCSIARSTSICENYGDDGLIRCFDEALPNRLKHGHQGYTGLVWSSSAKKFDATFSESGLVASLFGYSDPLRRILKPYRAPNDSNSRTSQSIRASVGRKSLRDMSIFDWHEPGVWAA